MKSAMRRACALVLCAVGEGCASTEDTGAPTVAYVPDRDTALPDPQPEPTEAIGVISVWLGAPFHQLYASNGETWIFAGQDPPLGAVVPIEVDPGPWTASAYSDDFTACAESEVLDVAANGIVEWVVPDLTGTSDPESLDCDF